MNTRFIKYKLRYIVSVLTIGLTIVSCEEYLDKAPEATITEKDVFGSFTSFQGFIEEIYNWVVDIRNQAGVVYTFLNADEMLQNTPLSFDEGNYWNAFTGSSSSDPSQSQGVWNCAWYGIRKANIALSKLDLLVDATQEEKDFIKGQALFFRGFFYFELMKHWGGMPYIEKVLSATEELKLPRLNYRETALKAAKDFEDAAALLPVDWDATEAGRMTFGNNKQRISKVYALSFLGKNYLYAASPMMNEESTGSATWDTELCKKAAAAFADVLNICTTTGVYKLIPWKNASNVITWTDNFWVWSPGNASLPGGTEAIMQTTIMNTGRIRYQAVGQNAPVPMGQGNNTVQVPTHNFLKNYGMANGLPIDDPLSGYNPADPWVGREPRFYSDIIVDGDELVANAGAGVHRFAQLSNTGIHRGGSQGSVTGYFLKRWCPKGCNQWDKGWDNFQSYIPYLRLADVYLMYAEAVLQGYGSATSSVPGSITAENAVNIIRNRAQLPNLTAPYTATKDIFMETIIRERAVELGFEGYRFYDLRRWNIYGQMKYREKTAIDFDRNASGKPINLKERIVITRVVEKKHNWVPINVTETRRYADFPQNPGW